MKFLKIPSLRDYKLLDKEEHKLAKKHYNEEYYVTEKLLGESFSIYIDKQGEVKIGSKDKFAELDVFCEDKHILSGIKELVNISKLIAISKDIFKMNLHFNYVTFNGVYIEIEGEHFIKYFSIIGIISDEDFEIGCSMGYSDLRRYFEDDELVPIIDIDTLKKLLPIYKEFTGSSPQLSDSIKDGYVLSPSNRIVFNYGQYCPTLSIKIENE